MTSSITYFFLCCVWHKTSILLQYLNTVHVLLEFFVVHIEYHVFVNYLYLHNNNISKQLVRLKHDNDDR